MIGKAAFIRCQIFVIYLSMMCLSHSGLTFTNHLFNDHLFITVAQTVEPWVTTLHTTQCLNIALAFLMHLTVDIARLIFCIEDDIPDMLENYIPVFLYFILHFLIWIKRENWIYIYTCKFWYIKYHMFWITLIYVSSGNYVHLKVQLLQEIS